MIGSKVLLSTHSLSLHNRHRRLLGLIGLVPARDEDEMRPELGLHRAVHLTKNLIEHHPTEQTRNGHCYRANSDCRWRHTGLLTYRIQVPFDRGRRIQVLRPSACWGT